MKILITNDDGFEAPGINALGEALSQIGEVWAVAPHQAISGSSHQVTTDFPIRVAAVGDRRFSVTGTPVDCVRIALMQLQIDADWVISGINDGGNLGVDTYMSGTVGGAREAALLGRKAIAISQYMRRQLPFEWPWAARFANQVLPQLMRRPLPARSFWNVNLPHEADYREATPELAFCPLDPHPLSVSYELVDGAFHYRSDYHGRKRKLGSDVDVCFGGRVSVSIVSLD